MNDAAEHILRMEQTLVEKDLIISSLKAKVHQLEQEKLQVPCL